MAMKPLALSLFFLLTLSSAFGVSEHSQLCSGNLSVMVSIAGPRYAGPESDMFRAVAWFQANRVAERKEALRREGVVITFEEDDLLFEEDDLLTDKSREDGIFVSSLHSKKALRANTVVDELCVVIGRGKAAATAKARNTSLAGWQQRMVDEKVPDHIVKGTQHGIVKNLFGTLDRDALDFASKRKE